MHGGNSIYETKPITYKSIRWYERVYAQIEGTSINFIELHRHMHDLKSLVQKTRNEKSNPIPQELLLKSNPKHQ